MNDGQRVVITGASGLIGKTLSTYLANRGYEAVAFARSPAKFVAPSAEMAQVDGDRTTLRPGVKH